MFCKNCGSQLEDGALFCTNCGANNAAAAPAQEAVQTPQYQAPQYQTPQYQAPQYQTPQYQAPQYQAPQYQAPQYQAPQYQAPQYQAPVVSAPAKRTPFPFIAAASMIIQFVFGLLPWTEAFNGARSYNMIGMFEMLDGIQDDYMAFFVVIFMVWLVAMCMLIPAFILAFIRREAMPKGLVVAACVLTFVATFLYFIFSGILHEESYGYVDMSVCPVFMLIFAIVSIIFASISRNRA